MNLLFKYIFLWNVSCVFIRLLLAVWMSGETSTFGTRSLDYFFLRVSSSNLTQTLERLLNLSTNDEGPLKNSRAKYHSKRTHVPFRRSHSLAAWVLVTTESGVKWSRQHVSHKLSLSFCPIFPEIAASWRVSDSAHEERMTLRCQIFFSFFCRSEEVDIWTKRCVNT